MYKILFIIFAAVALNAGNNKQLLNFSRPAYPGDEFSCSISASSCIITTTEFAETNTAPAISELKKTVQAKGRIRVIKVNKKGISTIIEFTPESFQGSINSKKIIPSWIGKTLKINLNSNPICTFKIINHKTQISTVEIQLLDLIFKPAPEYSLADLINPQTPIAEVDSWQPDLNPFLKIFKNQGIETNEILPLSGKVKLIGKKTFQNYQCWNIQEKVTMKNIPGIKFDFFLSTLIPIKKNLGPSLHTVRKIYEKIEKLPTSNSFMTSGIKKISLEMTEAINITSIPILPTKNHK
jgi:hypothetical protein